MSWAGLLVLGAVVLALVARASLARLEPSAEMRARLHPWAMAAGLAVAMLASLALGPGGGAGAARAGLVGLLLAAAWTDRQTAWAPDALMVPLMALAGAVSAPLGGWLGPWGGALAGLGLYALCQGLWLVQGLLGRPVLTPPDAAALALPMVLFGLSFMAAGALMGCAALLAAARALPALRRALSPEAPLRAALEDTGHAGTPPAQAVAFLPVMLPLVALGVALGG